MTNFKSKLYTWVSDWLKKPFPVIEKLEIKIFYIIFFGIFVSLFIALFKPFGFYKLSYPYIYYYALAFGISSSLSLAIVSLPVPALIKKFFNRNKWNIGRQILFMTLFFLVFTGDNLICYHLLNINEIINYSQVSIIGISFSLGIIPSVLFILILERQQLKKNEKEVIKNASGNTKTGRDIQFYSSNKQLEYTFKSTNINCIKGCGNYYIVYYENEDSIQQKIIRNTLKSLENQLDTKQFIRCHKSYIVNSDKIISATGNSKDLKIHTAALDFSIPVSRNLSKKNHKILFSKIKDINR